MMLALLSRLAAPLRLATAVVLAAALTPQPGDAVSSRDRDLERGDQPKASVVGPAVLAVVSIRDQRISLYDANGAAVRARVSSGQTGYETPVGVYSILQKKEEHYSNLYDDASMPFMQRITWSGIALHAGALPGYPASHGCVRLPHSFAEQIFGLTRMGMRVVVARDDVAPVEISHPVLLQPKPAAEVAVAAATPTAYEPEGSDPSAEHPLLPDVRNWPERQRQLDALKAIAAVKLAEARAASEKFEPLSQELKKRTSEHAKFSKALRAAEIAKQKADKWAESAISTLAGAKTPKAIKRAETNKAQALKAVETAAAKLAAAQAQAQPTAEALARATEAAKAAEKVRDDAVAVAKEAERKTLPVSIFISLKTQRLYVRQGNEPVFDSAVVISDPNRPIGTHIYTAVDYANGGDDLRWNVVTIGRRAPDDYDDYDGYDGWDRKRRPVSSGAPKQTDAAAATAALERVTMPSDVTARISDYVWPASSIIISDEEASKETGKATDFVVLISGEPQGALKKRKRMPPSDMFYAYDDRYYYRYDGYRRPPRYRSGKTFFGWW